MVVQQVKFGQPLFFIKLYNKSFFRLNHASVLLIAPPRQSEQVRFTLGLIAILRSPKKRSLLGVNEHFEGKRKVAIKP